MRKILLVCSLLVVFLGIGFNTKASVVVEPEVVTEVIAKVESANAQIESLVAIAQSEAKVLEQNLSSKEYNTALKELIAVLVEETNAVANEAKEFAAKNGVLVECEYIKYEVGHKNVKIDPLIVIAWGVEISDSTVKNG
ncbi:MAG: hypothetical protein K0Q49_1159 [Haloplasmataceae bacterium]|jgi:hypothetical protein|nr:hypothetical protein [Haloplasmataceae bacterium]